MKRKLIIILNSIYISCNQVIPALKFTVFTAILLLSFAGNLYSMVHDQRFVIPSNAKNNDYVGKLILNPNTDTLSVISYSIETDVSGIFGISGSYLVVKNNAGIQPGTTCTVVFKVTNGTYTAKAKALIYVVPVALCRFLDLDGGDSFIDVNSAFVAGTFYLAKRGTSETISQPININAPVTIGAYGAGKEPIVSSNATDNTTATFRTQTDGITIRDLTIGNTTLTQSVLISYCNDVIIDNCTVTGNIFHSNGQGIRTYVTNGIAILNTTIHDVGNDAIFIQGTVGTEIGYCTVYNTGRYMFNGGNSSMPVGDCIQTANSKDHDNIWIHHGYFNKVDNVGKACFMFQSTNQDGDFTIEYNKIISNSSNDNMLFNLNMDTLIFRGNFVSDSRYKLLGVYHSTDGGTVNYGLIENNIFVKGSRALELRGNKFDIVNNVFCEQSSCSAYIYEPNGDYDYYNNIFVQDADGTYAIQGYSNASGKDTVRNNLYYPSVLLGTNYSAGINAVIGDPQFINSTSAKPYNATNFLLKSTSPAINAGFDYGRRSDMLGYRIANGIWDIGPFEYGSGGDNSTANGSLFGADSDISYYPQPVTNILNINHLPDQSTISVYDLAGHKVLQQFHKIRGNTKIDMSRLRTGIYLLKITNNTAPVKNFKVIKN